MENAIFKRKSVRKFTDEVVDEKKVTAILKAAMAAPSAGNQQPWEFYVVTKKETLKKLGEATKYSAPAGEAPLAIVACSRNKGLRFEEYVPQDMGACVENILLEAVNQGLGAVWMGVAPKQGRMEIVRNILNIPASLNAFAIIAVGYSAEGDAEPQKRFDESRIHYISFDKMPLPAIDPTTTRKAPL